MTPGSHTCTHTCTHSLAEVHTHAHTQAPRGISAVVVGFQLPDSPAEIASKFWHFRLSSSLSQSLWEEPAVRGTEGGGRGCGWGPSHLISILCSALESLLQKFSAPPLCETGEQFAARTRYLQVAQSQPGGARNHV